MNYEPLPVSYEKVPTLKKYGKEKALPREGYFKGWHVYGITKAARDKFDLDTQAHKQKLAEGKVSFEPAAPTAKRLTPKPIVLESAMREYVVLHERSGTTKIEVKQLRKEKKQ